MSVDTSTLERVASLAKLRLDDEERRRLAVQLARILEYVEQLGEVDVGDVPPSRHAVELGNIHRADQIGACLGQAEALANAPEADEGHFLVPRVLPRE